MKSNALQKKNNWQTVEDKLADGSSLPIVIADENSPALSKSNNNSVCQILYNSEDFAPEWTNYCEKAFKPSNETGKNEAKVSVKVKTEIADRRNGTIVSDK